LELWGVAAASLVFCLSALAQQPPLIRAYPQFFESVTNGSNVLFTVTAQGHKPLHYQWLFNALPIGGATNSELLLTNVQCSNSGLYSVTITNIVGSVTSPGATLVVIDTIPPAISCNPDMITTQCGPIFFGATALDNCDSPQAIRILGTSSRVTNGLIEVITTCFQAYDTSGNVSSQCCQRIFIFPFEGYVPPSESLSAQLESASAQSISLTFTLQRGLPDINAGSIGSALGPRLSTQCGLLSGTNLWFRIGTLDTGPASIRVEGATLVAVYEGIDCDPRNLHYVTCCPANNRQCQVQFFATLGQRYWLVLEGVRSSIPLKIAYGFDPRVESIHLMPGRAVALTSSIAPAVIYTLQATTNLQTNLQSWSNLLTTRLTTSSYLSFLDTNAPNLNWRFYRIVPGP